MAAPKRAKAETVSISRAVDPRVGSLDVTVFDGTRSPIKQGTKVLLTVRDGFQNQLYREYVKGSRTASPAGFATISGTITRLLFSHPARSRLDFSRFISLRTCRKRSIWCCCRPIPAPISHKRSGRTSKQSRRLRKDIAAGLSGEPGDVYGSLIEDHPDRLACLLNITTAMQQILLAQGTPLDYFKVLDIDSLAPDRFFGYADAKLVSQVESPRSAAFLRPNLPAISFCIPMPPAASNKCSLARRMCS